MERAGGAHAHMQAFLLPWDTAQRSHSFSFGQAMAKIDLSTQLIEARYLLQKNEK